MWIEKIQIRNFGKLQDKTVEFSEGINVVYGANEAGKSTIHTFLLGMLFGMEKSRGRGGSMDAYQKYEPWNSASYYVGNMVMQIGKKRFFLERNFYHKEKTSKLRNLEDGEELSVEFGDLEMLLGGITKENYQNTYCISQAGFQSNASLAAALESYMADVSNSGGGSVQIQSALDELSKKKRRAEKDKKHLQATRQGTIEKLTVEAELLRKDIAMYNQSDLSAMVSEQTDTESETGQRKVKSVQTFGKFKRWCFLIGMLLAGFLCLLMPLRWLGVLLLLVTIGVEMRDLHKQKMTVPKEEIPTEVAEELLRIQEQRTEKENRCYNIEEQLSELAEASVEEQRLEEEIQALELAASVIQRIAKQIYEDIGDELHEVVSQNLSQITNGKYDSIILDEALHLFIWENGKKIPVNQLSRGTLEQAYLAMRMAVGSIFMREERMPVLLDETFCMYDEQRLTDTLGWLAKYPGQMILFSCQKREMEILERIGVPYRKIVLD